MGTVTPIAHSENTAKEHDQKIGLDSLTAIFPKITKNS